jgi:hypothetical protein
MDPKLIIGCVIGWYFLSIMLLFIVAKFSDSIIGELEFSKLCDYLGNQFDEVTKFEDSDPIVKTLLALIGLPFFPVLLVGYLIFCVLRAFYQVFLKLPLKLFDLTCEEIRQKIQS